MVLRLTPHNKHIAHPDADAIVDELRGTPMLLSVYGDPGPQSVAVTSLEDAQAAFITMRDMLGWTASTMLRLHVWNASGRVATISYNARVWTAHDDMTYRNLLLETP